MFERKEPYAEKIRQLTQNGDSEDVKTTLTEILTEFFQEPIKLDYNDSIVETWKEIGKILDVYKIQVNELIPQEKVDDFLMSAIQIKAMKLFKVIASSKWISVSKKTLKAYKEAVHEVGCAVQIVKKVLKYRLKRRYFTPTTTMNSKEALIQNFKWNDSNVGPIGVQICVIDEVPNVSLTFRHNGGYGDTSIDITSSCRHMLEDFGWSVKFA